MRFKHESLRDELTQVPSLLLAVVADFEKFSHEIAGIDPLITRVLEAIEGSSGVHEAGRAVDFRDEYLPGKFMYPQLARETIVARLNQRYARRDGKPTCLWHSFQGAPHHFHVQITADVSQYRNHGPEDDLPPAA